MMNLIFMGAPGSGKGTQNKFFEDRNGLVPISTGDMFRAAIAAETDIGIKAKSFMDKGELVPDEVTLGIVRERLEKRDFSKGFILDGFPRNEFQARSFEKLLGQLSMNLDKVIFIDVPKVKLIERLSGRKTCRDCNNVFNISSIGDTDLCPSCKGKLFYRDDDREEVINKRLETYNRETLPLINYYKEKSLLIVVDGSGDPEVIYEEIGMRLGLFA